MSAMRAAYIKKYIDSNGGYEDWLKGETVKLQSENMKLAEENKMLKDKLGVIEVVIDWYKNHEKKQGDMQSDITKN